MPAEQDFQGFQSLVSIGVAFVGEFEFVFGVGVRIAGGDLGGVAVVFVPDPAVELVDAVAVRFEGGFAVAFAAVWVFPCLECPIDEVAAFFGVVDELSLVEMFLCGAGDERYSVDFLVCWVLLVVFHVGFRLLLIVFVLSFIYV